MTLPRRGIAGHGRPWLAALLLASLAPAPAGAGAPEPAESPALALMARVESRLALERPSLVADLSHYGLVFPVAQAELLAYMRQIRVLGDGQELALGTAYGFESHGGGLLALLLDHWRPEGRPAALGDRFAFEANRASVALAAIYASHRAQIFLPVPGRARDEIRAELPDSPQLARMRFRLPGSAPVEADAYHFLELLAVHEVDLARAWTNSLGQRLSAELLLEHARRHYLSSGDTAAEPEDHSNLHLVEVLLAASRRRGRDPEEIQQRFLRVELMRREFSADDAELLLGHYVESLGRLLAEPRVRWSAAEAAQARDWLGWLERTHFEDLAAVAPRHLTHLLLGLRLVREHRARLVGAEPDA
jgi:hypothetical protein